MASNLRSNAAWRVLTIALGAELVAGAILMVVMIPRFPGGEADAVMLVPLWLSLFICVAVWWVWIGATFLGAIRHRRRWVRSSSVTSHILLLSAGLGVLQGILGTPEVGFALVAVAVVGLIASWIAKPTPTPEWTPSEEVSGS